MGIIWGGEEEEEMERERVNTVGSETGGEEEDAAGELLNPSCYKYMNSQVHRALQKKIERKRERKKK